MIFTDRLLHSFLLPPDPQERKTDNWVKVLGVLIPSAYCAQWTTQKENKPSFPTFTKAAIFLYKNPPQKCQSTYPASLIMSTKNLFLLHYLCHPCSSTLGLRHGNWIFSTRYSKLFSLSPSYSSNYWSGDAQLSDLGTAYQFRWNAIITLWYTHFLCFEYTSPHISSNSPHFFHNTPSYCHESLTHSVEFNEENNSSASIHPWLSPFREIAHHRGALPQTFHHYVPLVLSTRNTFWPITFFMSPLPS